MPKKRRMFPGITRQVVISDDTHRILSHVAQQENKYIGELADEIIRRVLEDRHKRTQSMKGAKRQGRYSPQVSAH